MYPIDTFAAALVFGGIALHCAILYGHGVLHGF
jgi:hypothetical protein